MVSACRGSTVYTYILVGYSIISYWHFAARAVVASKTVAAGATRVRMSEGFMSIISSRLGYTNELKGIHGTSLSS